MSQENHTQAYAFLQYRQPVDHLMIEWIK